MGDPQFDASSVAPARIILRDDTHTSGRPLEEKRGLISGLWDQGFVRKTVILIALGIIWEIYGRVLNNP